MSEEKSKPEWENKLDIHLDELKCAATPSFLFAKKLQLEGYLDALLHARLIDAEQLTAFVNRIERLIYSKLF